ncbi:hypothetical protein [Streptomyces sp. NPDC023588]|uniref:hypothetical protein n=1 Tax=Streptomyces sp. NPDC023588 TaxID=3154907 RepID=UPI0033E0105D
MPWAETTGSKEHERLFGGGGGLVRAESTAQVRRTCKGTPQASRGEHRLRRRGLLARVNWPVRT